MPEIFTRAASVLNGVFSADTGRLSFGQGVSTVLVQSFAATYMQTVTRLYEVGNQGNQVRVYYIGGRSQGNLTIARVIGPSVVLAQFYAKYGNVCFAKSNILEFSLQQTDCSEAGPAPAPGGIAGAVAGFAAGGLPGAVAGLFGGGGGGAAANKAAYRCDNCVITQLGISVAAQDMIINENSQVMFTGMDYTGS